MLAALLLCLLASPARAQGELMVPLDPIDPPVALPVLEYTRDDAVWVVDASKHKLTAVHFWATWCVPCVAELPEVDKVSGRYKDKGLQVIPISLDGNLRVVQDFYSQKNISHLPVALDTMNRAFSAAHLRGLPATLFVNAEGNVIARAEGPLDWYAKATTELIERQLK